MTPALAIVGAAAAAVAAWVPVARADSLCYINSPASYLSLDRVPVRAEYIRAALGPLCADLSQYTGIDATEPGELEARLQVPLTDMTGTRGEIALYINHVERMIRVLGQAQAPAVFFEDDALAVLPGLWDAPLDVQISLAGAAYSLGIPGGSSSRDESMIAAKWGDASAWQSLPFVTWLNWKQDAARPPIAGRDWLNLWSYHIEWPWQMMRTDVTHTDYQAWHLNGTGPHSNEGLWFASPMLAADWERRVYSMVSYVAHPRLLPLLKGLLTADGKLATCPTPCVADVGLTSLMSEMVYPRVQSFSCHPLAVDTGVRTGNRTAAQLSDHRDVHWRAFSEAHGGSIEQAMVELAWSVGTAGDAKVLNDFPGVFWTSEFESEVWRRTNVPERRWTAVAAAVGSGTLAGAALCGGALYACRRRKRGSVTTTTAAATTAMKSNNMSYAPYFELK